MGSALVLGGGGVTGIAWSTGLLLGLAEAGVDVTDAGLIVGTSAGAAVGAQVATGRSLAELYDLQLDSRSAELAAELDFEVLMPIYREMQAGLPLDEAARARIGAMALEAKTVGEPERRAVIEARLRTDDWPDDGRLRVTAIDAESGAFIVLDGTDGTGLVDAVAASCAVPGVWPPVTVGARRLIDGGIRSVVNADLAAEANPVLVVVPLSATSQVDITAEIAALEGGGARTLTLSPDAEAQSAMGINPLDPSRRRPSAEAGRRQAADFVPAVLGALATVGTMSTVWGEIQGQTITFPMEVESMNAATLLFSVRADAAAALLPGDAFEIAEVTPGTAQFVVAACDYVKNPWGDYNELNLGFLARPAGAPADVVGSFIYRMPVNQAFTCQAGNEVMGFPKTVEVLDADYTESDVTFRLTMGGHFTIAITVPRAEPMGEPERIEAESYSYLDGVAHSTPLSMDMGTGFVDPAAVVIELGDGPVADEVRSLGLPTVPDLATWGEGLSATFLLGKPLP